MVKDLSEAIYYCTITESMEKAEKQESETINNINYYTAPNGYNKVYPDYYRDLERENGYMYYPNNTKTTTGGNNVNYYTESKTMTRDPR